ncbi:hypothetical protein DFH08DRAFT_184654 [Mycena albidolilacea]|uniref:HNH nuclease domain-containing protein n=1 Tax=Mycena albidolilacea TaxID=1033008 RepID=A0AAD7ASA8_9AGAR|nr:hypothetical protein DFH08DRAFT_184654 [Mycena albidolilacea]
MVGALNWSEVSLDVCTTDLVCLATKHRNGLRTSHLCPRTEGAWFAHHTLSNQRFRIFTGDVNDPTNLVTMRADIGSTVFDQFHFVIVPINGRTCHYFVREECPEHVYSFHTRHAEIPSRINRALLFYRFAWATINLAHLLAGPATWHGSFIVPIPAALLESEQNLESNKKRKVSHPWSFATKLAIIHSSILLLTPSNLLKAMTALSLDPFLTRETRIVNNWSTVTAAFFIGVGT